MLVNILLHLVPILTTLLLSLLTYILWSFKYWPRHHIPHLPPRIPFGNLEPPSRRTLPIGLRVQQFYLQAKSLNYSLCGLYFFASPVLLLLDLNLIKDIMARHFDHFIDRGMYYNKRADPISAHLFAIGGSQWKSLRSKLTPTFTSSKIKLIFPHLVECVSLLQETLLTSKQPIEAKELLGRFATDVIGSCAFGLDCNTIREDDSPFRVYGKRVFASSKVRFIKMTLATNFPGVARLLGVRQIASDISEFYTRIVTETVDYRERNGVKRNDFMQLLIELKKDGEIETIEEVVAQAFIFFVAGFETSSTTMTFALYEIAKSDEIQERLRKEISVVLGRYNNQITYDAIQEMKFLDQILDETLRKYPPVPFVTRTCVKDFAIPETNIVIKKGRRIIIPIIGIQNDPEYYPEPEVFDPERFSEGNKQERNSYCHIPFGEGPRICIGLKFGLVQSKVGLVALLKDYRFKVNSRTKEPLKMALNSFTLTADGGIWIDYEKV